MAKHADFYRKNGNSKIIKCKENFCGTHTAEYARGRKNNYEYYCPICDCQLTTVFRTDGADHFRCFGENKHAFGCPNDKSGDGTDETIEIENIENLGAACLDFFGLDKSEFQIKKYEGRDKLDKPKERQEKPKKRKKITTYNMDPKLISDLETMYSEVVLNSSKEDTIEIKISENKSEFKKIKEIIIDAETALDYVKGKISTKGKKIIICKKCRPSSIGIEKLPKNTMVFRDVAENHVIKSMFFLVHFENGELYSEISQQIFNPDKHNSENIVVYGDWDEVSEKTGHRLIATQVKSQTCIFWIEK